MLSAPFHFCSLVRQFPGTDPSLSDQALPSASGWGVWVCLDTEAGKEAVIYHGVGLDLFRGWGGWAGMLAGAVFSGAGGGLVGYQCLHQEQGGCCGLFTGPS